MKALGDGLILTSKTATPVECLHYAMNLPTSAVITGINSMKILKQDLEAVKTFQPLTEKQVAEPARPDGSGGLLGQIRGVQDDEWVRRDGQEPGLAGGGGQGTRLTLDRPILVVSKVL
jgi:hypothetical protein